MHTPINNILAYLRRTKGYALPLVLAVVSYTAGYMSKDSSLSPDVRSLKGKVGEILDHIQKNYVEHVDLENILEESIEHMLHNLDPHSSYISKDNMQEHTIHTDGELEGIGIEFVLLKGIPYITAVMHNGPAEKAGLCLGDRIVSIGDKTLSLKEKSKAMDIANQIRGKKGSSIRLGIQRGSRTTIQHVDIVRNIVSVVSIPASYMVDKQTGYIKISQFTPHTFQEFLAAAFALQRQGMQALILDLQDNPGGYMEPAVQIASLMLRPNETIVQAHSIHKKFNLNCKAQGSPWLLKCPITVLVNESSASASEILAGALQDHDRAYLIGRRTFGKGLIQYPIPLQDSAEITLTVARYHTPSGRCIQRPYSSYAAYQADLLQRYASGEVYASTPSIPQDAQVYYTDSQRKVYGGGGICPDHIVPLQKDSQSSLLHDILLSPSTYQYVFDYADKHRKRLLSRSAKHYIRHFTVSKAMLQDFTKAAHKDGILLQDAELSRIRPKLTLYIKASLARKLWGDQAFYAVHNMSNDIFAAACKKQHQAKSMQSSYLQRTSQAPAAPKPSPKH